MYKGEQDYIKAMFILKSHTKRNFVKNQELSKYFSHTPQSVIEMIKRLELKGLVNYTPYKGSQLTLEGRQHAIALIRVHRLWEIFLVEHLGYDWEEVHDEAEELEHATSPRLENALFHFLGSPDKCPHGNPIPSYDVDTYEEKGIPLLNAECNKSYTLTSLNDDVRILQFLNKHGIKLGDRFDIVEFDELNENVLIESNKKMITIGYGIADYIKVQLIE